MEKIIEQMQVQKKWAFLLVLLVVISCLLCTKQLHKWYIVLLKKDGIVAEFNGRGEPDGEVLEYQHGRVLFKQTFVDGKKEGEAVKYYNSGTVKARAVFSDDLLQGISSMYYENGKLSNTLTYNQGKLYGNAITYYNNGKIESYNVFDIIERKFCTFQYDKTGKLESVKGFVVSEKFYSKSEQTDSIIVFDYKLYKDHYKNIKDLYITVATPPDLSMEVSVTINTKVYQNLAVNNNTIKISDAFPTKGVYYIQLKSSLYDKSKAINGINIQSRVIKD